jgi:hypothetical protein
LLNSPYLTLRKVTDLLQFLVSKRIILVLWLSGSGICKITQIRIDQTGDTLFHSHWLQSLITHLYVMACNWTFQSEYICQYRGSEWRN